MSAGRLTLQASKLSPELKAMAQSNYIRLPTPLPLFLNPPHREHLQEWADEQVTPMLRRIAKKVADNLQYISFDVFLAQLQKTINDFHSRVPSDEPYVLLIDGKKKDKLIQGCSDTWITGLAFEYCGLRQPNAILSAEKLYTYLKSYPNIKHVLMLDDAAYSGRQKSLALDFSTIFVGHLSDDLEKNKNLVKEVQTTFASIKLWLGIPYMSQAAKDKIKETDIFTTENTFFLAHQHILALENYLNNEEKDYFKKTRMPSYNLTLTYFDHRFGDYCSCFQPVYDSSNLLCAGLDFMHYCGYIPGNNESKNNSDYLIRIESLEEWNKLFMDYVPNWHRNETGYTIPEIFPPYRLHNADIQKKLKDAIMKGKVGHPKGNLPLDLKTQTVDDKKHSPTLEKSNPPTHKPKKAIASIQQQEGFDAAVIAGTWKTAIFAEELAQKNEAKKMLQQASAFKKIYTALRNGQSGFFKTNYLAGKENLSAETLIDLVKKDSAANPENRTNAAWKIAQAHYSDCTVENNHLITDIYKESFKRSRLFSRSMVTGQTFFRNQPLKKIVLSKIEIQRGRQKANSRTAFICQAIGG